MIEKQGSLIAMTIALLLSAAGCEASDMGKSPENDGMVTLSGRFAGQGVVCPQFRLDDGETISLSGDYPQRMDPEEPVILKGRWARESKCMQGREFRVFR